MIKKSDLINKVQSNEGTVFTTEEDAYDYRRLIYDFLQFCLDNKIEGISTFRTDNWTLSRGDFRGVINYALNDENYFLFYGANSHGARPQSVGYGKLIDGQVYAVVESPSNGWFIIFTSVKDIRKARCEYDNTVSFLPTDSLRKISSNISKMDLRCYEAAYESFKIFESLMNETVLKLER